MEFAIVLMATHRTIIEPTSLRGERGQYYRAYFGDGVLIDEPWIRGVPGVSCAGVTGRLEVWRLFTDEFQPDAVFGERGVSASGWNA
jgi:hypothetical protein